MNYYDDEHNVDEYTAMADGYDGRELVPFLRQYVPDESSVLELGMGPGKDLALLAQYYRVTGSDLSAVFVDRYLQAQPDADVLQLDAVTLATDRRFDAVYSNKVLYHLSPEDMRRSLKRQATIVGDGGIAFHTLWYGATIEEMPGLRLVYYTEDSLKDLVGPEWEIVEVRRYSEMEPEDSLVVVLRRTGTVHID